MTRDPNLEHGRRSPGSSEVVPIQDWRLPQQEPAAAIKWPQLQVFDSGIRDRLEPILMRREAEQVAERGLSRSAQARRWRSRLKRRRREFADALELSISEPFNLDLISHPPGPPEWWFKEWNRHGLCTRSDIDAGFNVVTAAWLRDGRGLPAMVVTQPHFLDYAVAVDVGDIESAKFVRNIDILEAPPELAWAGPRRKLLMWVPTP